jgi:hypothetical protein
VLRPTKNSADHRQAYLSACREARPAVDHVLVTRDGQSYAYSYQQFLSDLFVVEGLR